MTPVAIAALAIDALLTLVVTTTSGLVLYMVKRRADRERDRDAMLRELAGDMRSLREGMSQGAREAIGRLNGRLDVAEDELEQLGERVIANRERLAALDRTVEGHIRNPGSTAHPPVWGPLPAG